MNRTRQMKTTLVLSLVLAIPGCDLFAGDFEVSYRATVLRVEALADATGTRVRCDVQLTATAVGNDGDRGKWGESVWTFTALGSGVALSEQNKSSAAMRSFFGTEDIGAGESIKTSAIQTFQSEPFRWDFSLNYRNPNGPRSTREASVDCEP